MPNHQDFEQWDSPTLTPEHLRELGASGIDEAIARLNFQSLSGQAALEAVAGLKLDKATGHGQQYATKGVSMTLEKYQHCGTGGWWCSGLDPLNKWLPMEWGCFKPDDPRTDTEGKVIKYEHPPSESVRAFFLRTEDANYWGNVEGDRSIPIILTEGAKKAACGLSHGLATVAVPGIWQVTKPKANELKDDLRGIVQGRLVYIAFDEDSKAKTRNAVKAATKKAAIALMGAGAKEVKVIRWKNSKGKGMDDFIVNQGIDEFRGAIAKAEVVEPKKGGQSIADALIEVGMEAHLWRSPSPDQEAYADITEGEARVTYRINSREFKRWLLSSVYRRYGKAAKAEAISTALAILEQEALSSGNEYPVFCRLGGIDGKYYLDLGTDKWDAVEFSKDGWRVVTHPPVRFQRSIITAPIPYPVPGGDLSELYNFINVRKDDRILVDAFLLKSLVPDGEEPIIILHGEAETGKSTAAKSLKRLVDPGRPDLIKTIKDVRTVAIYAEQTRVIVYDNLSHLTLEQSDLICTMSTGGGHLERALHTDNQLTTFEYKRPQILTSISEIATQGDLLSRSIFVELDPIKDGEFSDSDEYWRAFDERHPFLLGGLLDSLCMALSSQSVTAPKGCRMVKFAKLAIAVEEGLGYEEGTFLARYAESRDAGHTTAVESSDVAVAIRNLLQIQPLKEWSGTATDLLEAMDSIVEDSVKRRKLWPRNPSKLSGAIKRVSSNLRAMGVVITQSRTKTNRLISIKYSPPAEKKQEGDASKGNLPSPSVTPSPPLPCKGSSGDETKNGVVTLPSSAVTTAKGDGKMTLGDGRVTLEKTPSVTPQNPLTERDTDPSGDGGDGGDGKKPLIANPTPPHNKNSVSPGAIPIDPKTIELPNIREGDPSHLDGGHGDDH